MGMKNIAAALLAALLLVSGARCAADAAPEPSAAQSGQAASQAGGEVSSQEAGEPDAYIFTDSAGRKVELPRDITRIAPSGPLAQIVLYTLCPDKFAGFASGLSDVQFEYMDRKYADLPVFGNFYADTLNLESAMAAAPQVVFDIGEAKPTAKEDMDGIQDKTGVPAVFVQMDLNSMADAYMTLGELVGEREQAQKIAAYIQNTLKEAEEKAASIPEAERVKVYFGQDEGLTASIKGTVHADVIDLVGAINVAEVEKNLRGGLAEVSMEQLMLWQPDVIIFSPGPAYSAVASAAEWQGLSAVKNGRFFEVPEGPYNWMGRPPSVNRILGVKWLGNLLYPEVFDCDMAEETKEFYKLFYHCDVTDEQVDVLLAKSTYKR